VEADLERIERIWRRQGFDYSMPDLDDPVFAIGKVAEDGSAAAFVKIVGEAYLFLDPNRGTPFDRWRTLLTLHAEVREECAALGISEVGCVLPPGLPKAFHRRLARLGWIDEPEDWKRKTFHLRKVTL
jgi:hypothetical protein